LPGPHFTRAYDFHYHVGVTATLIDGNALSQRFREQIAARVADVRASGAAVALDAVLVESGDNGARVYAENQAKTCAALGIDYRLHLLPATSVYDDIAGRVLLLSSEPKVTAIMLHMPLPAAVDPYRVQRLIAPEKDVEGVNPANIGNVVYGPIFAGSMHRAGGHADDRVGTSAQSGRCAVIAWQAGRRHRRE
jgi:5,10-methylene-tetrahydrofolate dehydrogenase/methenyl tetrahydrofolate cyclohydrolase